MKKASGHQDFLHELIIDYSGNIFNDSSKHIALAGNCREFLTVRNRGITSNTNDTSFGRGIFG